MSELKKNFSAQAAKGKDFPARVKKSYDCLDSGDVIVENDINDKNIIKNN